MASKEEKVDVTFKVTKRTISGSNAHLCVITGPTFTCYYYMKDDDEDPSGDYVFTYNKIVGYQLVKGEESMVFMYSNGVGFTFSSEKVEVDVVVDGVNDEDKVDGDEDKVVDGVKDEDKVVDEVDDEVDDEGNPITKQSESAKTISFTKDLVVITPHFGIIKTDNIEEKITFLNMDFRHTSFPIKVRYDDDRDTETVTLYVNVVEQEGEPAVFGVTDVKVDITNEADLSMIGTPLFGTDITRIEASSEEVSGVFTYSKGKLSFGGAFLGNDDPSVLSQELTLFRGEQSNVCVSTLIAIIVFGGPPALAIAAYYLYL